MMSTVNINKKRVLNGEMPVFWLIFVFVITIGLVACQPEADNLLPTATNQIVVVKTATAVSVSTPLPQPTAVPAPALTAVPTSLPLVATRNTITLSAPESMQTSADQAVSLLNEQSEAWQWEWASENGNIRLLPDASGQLILQEPIVLAVPFTLAWENTSIGKAQEILATGNAVVTVLPWSKLTPQLKALRVNGRFPTDPAYPLQNSYSLVADAGFETAVAELLPILQPLMQPEPSLHLAAVGDLMLDRSLGAAIQRGSLAYPFAHFAEELQQADLTIGNVESALGNLGQPAAKSYPFRAPPEAANALAMAGFDIVSLANNHAMDYGPQALLQGINLLKEASVAPIGAGENETAAHTPYITEVNGLRLAFLSYVHVPIESQSNFDTASWTATADAPGLAWANPDQIQADVTAVSPQVDLVIVSLHSGYEYVEPPSPPQQAAAHAAIKAGAALVIGHHAHILQGVEFYQGGVILYGTGNFAFEIDGAPETAVFHIWLDKGGVRQVSITPAIIQFGGQPRLATAEEAAAIRQQFYILTNSLNPQ